MSTISVKFTMSSSRLNLSKAFRDKNNDKDDILMKNDT